MDYITNFYASSLISEIVGTIFALSLSLSHKFTKFFFSFYNKKVLFLRPDHDFLFFSAQPPKQQSCCGGAERKEKL
jgi:hypothetical protein